MAGFRKKGSRVEIVADLKIDRLFFEPFVRLGLTI